MTDRVPTLLPHRRLKEYKDTVQLFIFTLDLVTRKYPIITAVENLPHDCTSILPCAPSLGGVIITTSNALIYVDQASRRTALPVNGWAPRTSDLSWQTLRPDEQSRNLQLEGASTIFMDEQTFFVILKDGTIYPVEIVMDGKIVSRLSMGAALAQTTIPSVVTAVDREWLFVGSTVAASVVLRATKVEEEVPREEQETQSPAAVVDAPRIMDIDDDDGTFCQGRSYFMFLPILTKYIQISMGILRTRLRQFPTRLQEGTLHLWNFDPLSIFLYVIHCLLMVRSLT